MCFDRNINGNRNVKILECDYLSVQRCVKLTLSLPSVRCFQHFQKFWNIADIRIVEEFLLAIFIKLKAKTCKGHDDVVSLSDGRDA